MAYVATIKKTREICDKYQLYTKKKFGQNFIIEPKIVEKIARVAIENDDDVVLEIGPGIGALTQFLCLYGKKVISYEVDNSLKSYWNDNRFDNLEIVFDDFLNVNLSSFIEKYGENTVVAANLPYYITTPILFKLFEYSFKKITVMMQKEVADRFNAKPNTKHYNALSVIAQYKYDIKLALNVSRNIFMPVPNVDSAVISFIEKKNRTTLNEKLFYEFIHCCFKQRRKTLYNNLKHLDNILYHFEKCGIKENQRAQELTLEQFEQLFLSVNYL